MNSSYYQNQINKIEKDIADFQKKIADEYKKEADKNKQISSVNNSITKSTSLSSLQSKNKQIQGYQNDILNFKKKIAEYQKQIANKSSDLGKRKQELRKAEENENKKVNELNKKNQKEQLDFQKKLQNDIERQKYQLETLISINYSSTNAKENNVFEDKKFDFFISHASEDKDEIVRELAEALIERGFKVWYDEFELKIGDSLRKKIDNGLINSKFGVVIISPAFVKKNWTEYELNGMVAREMNGHKVILPIWHKITKDEVLKFSPSLTDKVAMNTSIHTIDEIVNSLQQIL